jgi:hypothetical protein
MINENHILITPTGCVFVAIRESENAIGMVIHSFGIFAQCPCHCGKPLCRWTIKHGWMQHGTLKGMSDRLIESKKQVFAQLQGVRMQIDLSDGEKQ